MTPIPLPIIASIQADTPEDYELRDTGFAVTIGSVMAKNLNVSILREFAVQCEVFLRLFMIS